MFIELIETLRCPNPHEDSWLVGAFDRLEDRDVRAGRLGCPVCRAEYRIIDGVVDFQGEAAASPSPELARAASSTMSAGVSAAPSQPIGADAALRLAAMLDLASPGGLIVLEGEWGRAGSMLTSLIESQLLLVDPPPGVAERERLSAIRSGGTIPVAGGSCRGIALYSAAGAGRLAPSAVKALRARGRLVAPAGVPLPDEVQELARDATWWVAERTSPPPSLVPLGSRRRG